MARFAQWLKLAALLGVAVAFAAIPLRQATADVKLPGLENRKGDKCVEDVDIIRRNHPDLLKHHRIETLRQGIRTTKYSLKGCVECHASAKTCSVASTKDDFCVTCHAYAGVHLDCWGCHASKPKAKSAPAADQQASPTMNPVQTGGVNR